MDPKPSSRARSFCHTKPSKELTIWLSDRPGKADSLFHDTLALKGFVSPRLLWSMATCDYPEMRLVSECRANFQSPLHYCSVSFGQLIAYKGVRRERQNIMKRRCGSWRNPGCPDQVLASSCWILILLPSLGAQNLGKKLKILYNPLGCSDLA